MHECCLVATVRSCYLEHGCEKATVRGWRVVTTVSSWWCVAVAILGCQTFCASVLMADAAFEDLCHVARRGGGK